MLTLFENPHYAHVFETHLTNNSSSDKDIWTFPAAVLFTTTTIIPVGKFYAFEYRTATVEYCISGYGNVCPASELGRLLLVIYGMIGIPLALVTMADTGKFISRGVTIWFEDVGCQLHMQNCKKHMMWLSPVGEPYITTASSKKLKHSKKNVVSTLVFDHLFVRNICDKQIFELFTASAACGNPKHCSCEPITRPKESKTSSLWQCRQGCSYRYYVYIPLLVVYCSITTQIYNSGMQYISVLHRFSPLDLPSINVIYLVVFILFGVILVTITIDFVAAEVIDHIHYMGRHVGKAREIAGKMMQLAQSINMNRGITGLTAGMNQLQALARFGLLGKIDRECTH
ncbi:unnamed protein product [Strongylus vulgaris]|uniref:Potassium channel domain-containing protein n=1 Tax=Strongylus vulgaris TaxID=40348 RepID=A0A3P7L707_STRVU|nr:unnamed protein product [Strongylus vulgaris]